MLLPSAVRLATYSRVRLSQLIRPSASTCSARLASLLPARLHPERDRLLSGGQGPALLLVGLAGGYRVSELASLEAGDVEFADEGAIFLLRKSKTNRAGGGYYKGIPYGEHAETCPVSALRAWMALLPEPDPQTEERQPLFRGVDRHGNIAHRPMASDSISRAVKKRARNAGLDEKRYSGHSLRGARDGRFGERGSRQGHHAPDRPPVYRNSSPLPEDRGALQQQPRQPPRSLIQGVGEREVRSSRLLLSSNPGRSPQPR